MSDAARKAARGLNRDFGELIELQVSKKGAADYVSAADIKAEQVIFEALAKARPGYGFLGEERGMVEGTDKTHTWIVDPLDGTTNFLHAIPHFAVNIALEREGASLWAQAKPGLASGFARPDDLALAAYLDGRLDEAGRDRVEAALAADDRLLELALAADAALGATLLRATASLTA